MNEIIKKFLLLGDKLIPKKHLRQPGFTDRICGPFTKHKKKKTHKKLKKHEIWIYLSKRIR